MTPGERPLRALLTAAGLDAPLADPAVREVVVNRPGEFGVERADGWTWHEAPHLTFDHLDMIGILAASMRGRDVDASRPLCRATLPDGQRVFVARPPATHPGIVSLTVRKPSTRERRVEDDEFLALFDQTNAGPRRRSKGDEDLIALKRARDWQGFFKLAPRLKKTIGVTGCTGSGKTELLKTVMREVPEGERIVTVESDDEFGHMRQHNRVSLFYGDEGQAMADVTAEDCVKAALRMRPDRVMVQEVTGRDAFAFLRVLAAGHPGSVTSWHAEEGEAFDALELMVKQHPSGNTIPDAKIKQYLRKYLDVVVWCDRGEDGFSAPYVWLRAEEEAAPGIAA